ncbi:MAG: DUF3298 and DUF4163 domain-containing protein [Lachnospiraceae bacterium]|jgi:DNA-binding LytR/AlgR family response regulator|nr:DUF3298 and DUF4163 domain-containing protein [Lachnospiraceae bacterium]
MKDNRLEDMKVDYKTIKIPEELRQRVDMGIEQAKKEKEEEKGMRQKSKVLVFTKRAAGGVVAALLAITIMANSGASIAHAMEQIPVIGAIAKIVTFREYENSVNDMEAKIKIPEVSIENEDGTVNQENTEKINKSIQEYTDEIIARFEADVKASGGEGYQEVDLDYSVITDNDRLFSIRFDELLVMASGTQNVKIYHIDKKTGEMINLKGIFKENTDFINVISDNIKEQMKEQMAADEMVMYWLDSETPEWNFKSITEDRTFYINEAGKLVIVFDEYEVAPGYMGSVEFEIPTEIVKDLVQEGFLQ